MFGISGQILRFWVKTPWFLSFSNKSHAEPSINFVKNSVLNPKCAKLDQTSDFGHVRTYSWLHKLRNTQGKIYGTYLGNIYGIYIYIYMEYIRNIHKYLWYTIIRNTEPLGRRLLSDYLISWTSMDIPYIFLIYSIYIPYIFPSYVPYIFPCVFLSLWSQE